MTQQEWASFYGINQRGRGGMTYFRGTQHQRGSGLGSLFGGLLRAVMPAAKSALKTVGREAMRTGISVASDALAGADPLQSLEHHGRRSARKLLKKAGRKVRKQQTGRGMGTRLRTKRAAPGKVINRGGKRRRKAQNNNDFLAY